MNAHLPRRVHADQTIYLPRVIAIGIILAVLGLVLGWQHEQGTISALDLLATLLFVSGASLVGLGVRPE